MLYLSIYVNAWVFASHTDYKPGIYLDAYLLIFPIAEIKKLLHILVIQLKGGHLNNQNICCLFKLPLI